MAPDGSLEQARKPLERWVVAPAAAHQWCCDRAVAPAVEAAAEGARAVSLLAVVAVASGRLQAALPALEGARVHPRGRRKPCNGLAVRAVLDGRGDGADSVGLLLSAARRSVARCSAVQRGVAWRGVAWRGAAWRGWRGTELKTLIGLHSK